MPDERDEEELDFAGVREIERRIRRAQVLAWVGQPGRALKELTMFPREERERIDLARALRSDRNRVVREIAPELAEDAPARGHRRPRGEVSRAAIRRRISVAKAIAESPMSHKQAFLLLPVVARLEVLQKRLKANEEARIEASVVPASLVKKHKDRPESLWKWEMDSGFLVYMVPAAPARFQVRAANVSKLDERMPLNADLGTIPEGVTLRRVRLTGQVERPWFRFFSEAAFLEAYFHSAGIMRGEVISETEAAARAVVEDFVARL